MRLCIILLPKTCIVSKHNPYCKEGLLTCNHRPNQQYFQSKAQDKMIHKISQGIKTFHLYTFHISLNHLCMYHKVDYKARILCTQYRELYHPTNNLFHKRTSIAHKLGRHLTQGSRQVCIQCSLVQSDHCNEGISNDNHLNSSFPRMCLYNLHSKFNQRLC